MSLSKDSLLDYFGTRLGVDTAGIDDATPLFSSGVLDSFSIVELMTFIESQAHIRMDVWDVTLDNLDSIGRILAYVNVKKAS